MGRNDEVSADLALDELLRIWHEWASQYRPVRGYPTQAPTRRLHTISNQYADENGALDAGLDDDIAASVDAQVQAIADPHRAALHCDARRICTGAAVWSSPRLPRDLMARQIILVEARGMLIERLRDAGLL